MWEKTKPASGGPLVSADLRGNWDALDSAVMLCASARAQATPNLTVLVGAIEGWTAVGARVAYAGGSSPALTAPTTNPRIATLLWWPDIPTFFSWTYGAEAASPVAPVASAGTYPVIDVYCRPGMTAIYETDQGTQGYIRKATPRIFPIPSLVQLPILLVAGNPIRNVGTTVAETTCFASSAPTLAGGLMGGNGLLRLEVLGDLLQNSGAAGGVTWRVKYGGVTLATFVAITLAANATRRRWQLRGLMHMRNANNRPGFVGQLDIGPPEADGTGSDVAPTSRTSGTMGATVDSTVDQVFDVTVQPSASHASLIVSPYSIVAVRIQT